MKVKTSTIVRTALLVLAIINNLLSVFGKPVLPITDEQLELIVSTIITVVVALINWWKNNSYTKAAIEGDQLMNRLKKNTEV